MNVGASRKNYVLSQIPYNMALISWIIETYFWFNLLIHISLKQLPNKVKHNTSTMNRLLILFVTLVSATACNKDYLEVMNVEYKIKPMPS